MHLLAISDDHVVLRSAILLCLVAIPVALILLALDRRVLDDEFIWLKPIKFHLSLAVHAATVLLAARLLPEVWQTHMVTKAGLTLFGAVVIYEAAFLSIQAGRGVRSHFNDTSTFDAIGGTIMAAGAGVLVVIPLLIGAALVIATWRGGWAEASKNPLRLAVALGFILTGWLAAQTGSAIGANAGPFVGVDTSSGRFMPLTGWALEGGDYRISHFLGVHAMQAVSLVVLILLLIFPPAVVAALTVPVAAGWAALTLHAFAHAADGLPPL
ncbi:MAG: hypothetical protein QNJ44_00045 [Rhodobacter sp.]|nr:hypothetical protein [Rhodobacter sp.]